MNLRFCIFVFVLGLSTSVEAQLSTRHTQYFTQNTSGISDSSQSGDWFGWALASADFNGDGYEDLAISVPFETVEERDDGGAVHVLYGSENDLAVETEQFWHLGLDGMFGTANAEDEYGYALTTGDFDNDGFFDLAIGVPGYQVNGEDGGGVSVLMGSEAGLSVANNQIWHQDVAGIEGGVEPGDLLGRAVAAGNFNGDDWDDLAMGVPHESVGDVIGAGAVNVVYGSAEGLAVTGDQVWHQDSSGILDIAEQGDAFGTDLAAGDFDGDGEDDLAIGVILEGTRGRIRSGAVNVLYGTTGGLSSTDDQFWDQDNAGITGLVESNDNFSSALVAADFNGDGEDDLAIGVSGEDIGDIISAGWAQVIYGASGVGLQSAADQGFSQGSSGVQDTAESNDGMGGALGAGDFDGDGEDDLAIGVSGEDIDGEADAGAFHVLYGISSGLVPYQFWHQDSEGVPGSVHAFNSFGHAFAAGDFNNDGLDDLAVSAPRGGPVGGGAVIIFYGDDSLFIDGFEQPAP